MPLPRSQDVLPIRDLGAHTALPAPAHASQPHGLWLAVHLLPYLQPDFGLVESDASGVHVRPALAHVLGDLPLVIHIFHQASGPAGLVLHPGHAQGHAVGLGILLALGAGGLEEEGLLPARDGHGLGALERKTLEAGLRVGVRRDVHPEDIVELVLVVGVWPHEGQHDGLPVRCDCFFVLRLWRARAHHEVLLGIRREDIQHALVLGVVVVSSEDGVVHNLGVVRELHVVGLIETNGETLPAVELVYLPDCEPNAIPVLRASRGRDLTNRQANLEGMAACCDEDEGEDDDE